MFPQILIRSAIFAVTVMCHHSDTPLTTRRCARPKWEEKAAKLAVGKRGLRAGMTASSTLPCDFRSYARCFRHQHPPIGQASTSAPGLRPLIRPRNRPQSFRTTSPLSRTGLLFPASANEIARPWKGWDNTAHTMDRMGYVCAGVLCFWFQATHALCALSTGVSLF